MKRRDISDQLRVGRLVAMEADRHVGAHDLAAVDIQTLHAVFKPFLGTERLDLADLLGVRGRDPRARDGELAAAGEGDGHGSRRGRVDPGQPVHHVELHASGVQHRALPGILLGAFVRASVD